jgi:general secretion pathway protein D
MYRPLTIGRASRAAGAWLMAGTILATAGCTHRTVEVATVVPPLPRLSADTGSATPRISGPVSTLQPTPQVAVSVVPTANLSAAAANGGLGGGANTFNFADTDIREVAAQMLGNALHVNYTIDPSVHGTATLRTVTPLATAQVIPVLQSLLAQNGATLVEQHGVYRVLPLAAAAGVAGAEGTAGGMMVPLRYAAAEDLAKALQPYAQGGARIIAVPSSNAVVISGEPPQRDALSELVRAFDIDELAGQSYALFPVSNGDAADMADALKQAFRAQQGGSLATQIRVVPLARVNAVLVIANAPRFITEARRAFGVVERGRRQTMRTWHVYYLQNGTANDVAYVLQEAFTPGNVTAQPSARATGQPSSNISSASSLGSGGSGSGGGLGGLGGGSGGSSGGGLGGLGGGLGGGSSGGGGGFGGGLGGGLGGGSGTTGSGGQGAPTSGGSTGSNPLLGGVTNSGGSGGGNDANSMRIIPNPDNNAILIYGTGEEEDTVEAMLHKIDILPLQVRIDAIIAEVTLNDNLNYGTQFFFRHHSINGGLSNASGGGNITSAATSVLPLPQTALPNFVFNAAGKDGDLVLQALQDVTTVKVLSAPELLVLDNETASLQVGNQVPVQNGQLSTVGSTLGTVQSTSYVSTGVITLDVSQEVSSVLPQTSVNGQSGSSIASPTFSDRQVKSRIVVQDGQTIGMAGLITDNVTRDNSGIPFLKDVPVLGLIAGSQNNTRTRTELLILLTPHVLHDQRDARALTEDLRETLPRAAAMPYELQNLKQTGATDPQAGLRKSLGLTPQ